jgi:RimJ/RimL family protein N-acetyltransferase
MTIFGWLRISGIRWVRISGTHIDRNEPSRRIVEKLGFQKLGVAHNAATRCLDGTKLDRHEYILTSPHALPELDVSWG